MKTGETVRPSGGFVRGLGLFDQCAESNLVLYGQFRQRFAVKGNTASFHAPDKAAVADVITPAGRVYAHNPESAPFAFLFSAMDVSILTGAIKCFLGIPVKLRFISPIAAGLAQDALATLIIGG